jgi:hypothetical protein
MVVSDGVMSYQDICQDVTLSSPIKDCPRPDDDNHAKKEPYEQTSISPHRIMIGLGGV